MKNGFIRNVPKIPTSWTRGILEVKSFMLCLQAIGQDPFCFFIEANKRERHL